MRTKAFTLVELLVATVIATLVAVTAVGALHTITASREKVNQYLTAMEELRYAADMIRNDLMNLYRDKDRKAMKFIGDFPDGNYQLGSDLMFNTINSAPARPGQPEGDVYEVEYFIKADEEQSILMRRLDPYFYEKDTTGGVLAPIAENIVAFDVRYYDLESDTWETQWDEERKNLPTVIEVTLAANLPEQKKVLTNSFMVRFPRLPVTVETSNKNEGK
jgi:type II secretion system protein J